MLSIYCIYITIRYVLERERDLRIERFIRNNSLHAISILPLYQKRTSLINQSIIKKEIFDSLTKWFRINDKFKKFFGCFSPNTKNPKIISIAFYLYLRNVISIFFSRALLFQRKRSEQVTRFVNWAANFPIAFHSKSGII